MASPRRGGIPPALGAAAKSLARRCPLGWRLVGGVVLIAIAVMSGTPGALSPVGPGPASTLSQPNWARALAGPASIEAASLSLGIASTPRAICAGADTECPAGTGLARVTLTASASTQALVTWPDVQVVFVIEYTPLDGVYNPYDHKGIQNYQCPGDTTGSGAPCEESNGVPFFIVNAGEVASGIQALNPHSRVTFGMVDYYATNDEWDLDGGSEYHVDIGSFLPAGQFGPAVRATFQSEVLDGGWTYGFWGFGNNFLHSSSITALFGTLTGQELAWQNNTHHVVIWMGSSAPRDPNYLENYCVSPSLVAHWGWNSACDSSTCEPSYQFQNETSPGCEGWVRSQNGAAADNIASLAHDSEVCRSSLGGSCPIDMIDLFDTATDPLSKDWAAGDSSASGSGVGGAQVQLDVAHILDAGCDMAQATGGSWDGPSWWTCADGTQGSLQYVAHGPFDDPATNNPSLLNAFRTASFGPYYETEIARGGARPMFTFVPFGAIRPAPPNELEASAACVRSLVALPTCQSTPTVLTEGGLSILGWNFSTVPALNEMLAGDEWMASFNVVATGPPYATVPIDACILPTCFAVGSGPVDAQFYTQAYYFPATYGTAIAPSFPATTVTVQVDSPTTAFPLPAPPPPPPVPPAVPVPIGQPIPLLHTVGLGNQVGVGSVSLQGVTVGLLGAGFVGVRNRNRAIAMAVAVKSGVFRSTFEAKAGLDARTRPRWLDEEWPDCHAPILKVFCGSKPSGIAYGP